MSTTNNATDIFERQFLEMRCKVLDLAAALDRIDRAPGNNNVTNDPRRELLQQGINILLSDDPNRAEQIQLLFSDEYIDGWNQ